MDYFDIIRKAAKITFKHKFLWLFGFFAASSYSSLNLYNYSGSDINKIYQGDPQKIFDNISSYLSERWILFAVVGGIILLLLLIFAILNFISQGALIGCVNHIDLKKKTGIGHGFQTGGKHFFRILGIGFLGGLAVVIALLVLGAPIAMLFAYQLFGRALILLLIGLIIFIPLSIVVHFITTFGKRYAVIHDMKILNAMKMAFNLFVKNIGASILMGLLLFIIGMAAAIALLIAIFIVAIPFIALGFIAYAALKFIGILLVIIIGAVVLIALSVVYSAIISTYQSCVWTLFFKELGHKKE